MLGDKQTKRGKQGGSTRVGWGREREPPCLTPGPEGWHWGWAPALLLP